MYKIKLFFIANYNEVVPNTKKEENNKDINNFHLYYIIIQ